MIFWFKHKEKEHARVLYRQACDAARNPKLFPKSISDTPDGHFFSLSFHLLLLLKHLEGHKERKTAQVYARNLFAFLCQEMDDHLREQGMGDVSVGKKVKHMAATFAFYQKTLFPALETSLEKRQLAIVHAIKMFKQQGVDNTLALYIEKTFAQLQIHDPILCAQEQQDCGFYSHSDDIFGNLA